MKRRAVLVGVDVYGDDRILNLRYAYRDACKMESAFGGAPFGFETTALQNPSQAEVLGAIETSTKDLHAGDMFLFFFSGHGFSVGSDDLVFCPEDHCCDLACGNGAGLSHAKLKLRTSKENDQYDRIFIFDTCRSFLTGAKGVADDEVIVCNDGKKIRPRDLNPAAHFTRDVTGSVYFLRSCSPGEQSLEIPDRHNGGTNGNGLFTRAFLSVLRRSVEGGCAISLDQTFYQFVRNDMNLIKTSQDSNWIQTPEFTVSGETMCLWKPECWGKDSDRDDRARKRIERDQERERLERESAERKREPARPTTPEDEKILDEAITHMQFLCGGYTVDLPRNREDAEMRRRLGDVRMVFFGLDRTNRKGKRSRARYDESELAAMVKACCDLEGFLRERSENGLPAFLARECRASISERAEKLRGSRYAELAEAMLTCMRTAED